MSLFTDPIQWMRSYRDIYLKESDWTVLPDSPLSESKRAEWVAYRSALRDVPAQNNPIIENGDLSGVNWPTPPND